MLLIAGALVAETVPLLPLLTNKKIHAPQLISGLCADQPVAILTTGVGAYKAEQQCTKAIATLPIQTLLSVGTCGALRDGFQIGDVVTADRIRDEEDNSIAVPPIAGITARTIITVAKPVITAKKRARWAAIAHICEMEAMGVWKAAAGRPFHALKVISDQAGKEDDPALKTKIPGKSLAIFLTRATKLSHQYLRPALATYLGS